MDSCQPQQLRGHKEHNQYKSFAVDPPGTTLRLQKALTEGPRITRDAVHYFTPLLTSKLPSPTTSAISISRDIHREGQDPAWGAGQGPGRDQQKVLLRTEACTGYLGTGYLYWRKVKETSQT